MNKENHVGCHIRRGSKWVLLMRLCEAHLDLRGAIFQEQLREVH